MQSAQCAFRSILPAVLSLAIAACSSSTPSGGGSGGEKSSGGTPGSGGQPGTGGVSGTGGRVGSGGASSPGGATGSGGKSGTGGTGQSGGRVGSGGTTGPGGQTGSGSGGAAGAEGGSGGTSAPGRDAGRDVGPGNGGRGSGGSSGAGGSGGAPADGGGGSDPVKSAGCGKTPTLKSSTVTIQSGGASRTYVLRLPSTYDNTHPYRLILGFHGAGGNANQVAPGFFGLYDLSGGTTIFIAPSAAGSGMWSATADLTLVDDILKQVEADLCIDTTRIQLEGFSQGGAMVALLACSRPGVFRTAVGHSRGGLDAPTKCDPIPYLGSLGLSDIEGNSQATQTDFFAKSNGCTVETLPTAPKGGHVCTPYKGCPANKPVIWCSFDGPHTASPTDSGQSTSWMPKEVWPFMSQF